MRLHTLELQAIGPYATPQRIDFDRLAGSGLFLLEGPTGAGKTTILDAITFALYGGLSGDNAGGDRLHSDFAGPAVEPSVTLEFSVGGVRYRVRRVPEHERLRKRGDGYTTQAMQVHLERRGGGGGGGGGGAAGDRWVSQSSNKREAGELITEAVGLNRDQFTQVMMLPQGDFAKFLRSDDDNRRVVLTRLFGTQLYDLITAELQSRSAEAGRARQRAQIQIGTATAAAAEAAGLDEIARGDLLAAGSAECAARLKEAAAELGRDIEVTRAGLDAAAARLSAAVAAADLGKQRVALMRRLTQALDRLARHEVTRPEHARRADRLAAARRADPVRPLLAALDDAQDAERSARGALAELLAESDRVVLDDGAGQAAVLALADQAVGRAQDAERGAASLQYLTDLEAELPGRESAASRLREAAVTAATLVSRLEAAKRDLPDKITALDGQLAGARMAAAGLADATEQQAAVGSRLAAAIRLAGLSGRLAELDSAVRDAVDVHQHRVDAYQQAMEARLENMAAELADRLADGGPCPVCGSTDHPGPAAALAGAPSADEVGDAADLRDGAADARVQAQEARDAVAAEVAACAAAAGGGTVGSLETEHATRTERVLRADRAAAEVAELEPELADRRAEQEKLADDLTRATAALAAAVGRVSSADAELARLRGDLAAAALEYPSVSARQVALAAAAIADRTLAGALGRLAVAAAERDTARSRAERELTPGGFDTLAAARSAVLLPDEQDSLGRQVMSWTSDLAALTAAAQADDLAGLDPGAAAETEDTARAAAGALVLAQSADREARDAHRSLIGRDERLRQRMAELARAEEDASELMEETQTVIRLAGLARGMEGHRRVALTTYVLRRWFGQVVEAANLRLAAMSAGRYELRRTDEGEKKRERTGLTLAVIDRHTGEERSPKSLSGGETFYTSLALALGLADVVRAEAGGVELDTLFIDEGFGSLDAETLDQVMAVIDDLRDRGRAVGIVSHVADLKDRVHERLEVRRRPDGSSMATVVA